MVEQRITLTALSLLPPGNDASYWVDYQRCEVVLFFEVRVIDAFVNFRIDSLMDRLRSLKRPSDGEPSGISQRQRVEGNTAGNSSRLEHLRRSHGFSLETTLAASQPQEQQKQHESTSEVPVSQQVGGEYLLGFRNQLQEIHHRSQVVLEGLNQHIAQMQQQAGSSEVPVSTSHSGYHQQDTRPLQTSLHPLARNEQSMLQHQQEEIFDIHDYLNLSSDSDHESDQRDLLEAHGPARRTPHDTGLHDANSPSDAQPRATVGAEHFPQPTDARSPETVPQQQLTGPSDQAKVVSEFEYLNKKAETGNNQPQQYTHKKTRTIPLVYSSEQNRLIQQEDMHKKNKKKRSISQYHEHHDRTKDTSTQSLPEIWQPFAAYHPAEASTSQQANVRRQDLTEQRQGIAIQRHEAYDQAGPSRQEETKSLSQADQTDMIGLMKQIEDAPLTWKRRRERLERLTQSSQPPEQRQAIVPQQHEGQDQAGPSHHGDAQRESTTKKERTWTTQQLHQLVYDVVRIKHFDHKTFQDFLSEESQAICEQLNKYDKSLNDQEWDDIRTQFQKHKVLNKDKRYKYLHTRTENSRNLQKMREIRAHSKARKEGFKNRYERYSKKQHLNDASEPS
jgi:hypothetical protein